MICDDGFKSYLSKVGMFIMGGGLILILIVIFILLWVDLSNCFVWIILGVLVVFGVVGWVDDWCKVIEKNLCGLLVCWKYFW